MNAPRNKILIGDCLKTMRSLPDQCVSMCVTSPPYWGLRDYGVAGQLGQEATPAEFVAAMVAVFGELRRILRDDGTLWLNLGDTYASSGGERSYGSSDGGTGRGPGTRRVDVPGSSLKPKDLIGIPWRVALALQADGWYLRQDIIWHKPNPMPESVTDRCTKAHEYIFLLTKSERYWYDAKEIAEPARHSGIIRNKAAEGWHDGCGTNQCEDGERAWGESGIRNKRSVWTVPGSPYREAHFATFPPALIQPCILAGCPEGGLVFDPFGGSGTTGQVARALGRDYLLCELNPEYVAMAEKRIKSPLYDDSPKTLKSCAGQRDLFATPSEESC